MDASVAVKKRGWGASVDEQEDGGGDDGDGDNHDYDDGSDYYYDPPNEFTTNTVNSQTISLQDVFRLFLFLQAFV